MSEISNRVSILYNSIANTFSPLMLCLIWTVQFGISNNIEFLVLTKDMSRLAAFKLNVKLLDCSIANNLSFIIGHLSVIVCLTLKICPKVSPKTKKNDPEYRFRSFLTINCCKLIILLLIFHLDISIWFHWNDRNFGNGFQFWASKHFFPNF